MGCSQSKAVQETMASLDEDNNTDRVSASNHAATSPRQNKPPSKKKKKKADAGPTPVTRKRADSWAVAKVHRSVEAQWEWIWKTQQALLTDPSDVHAVLDELLNAHCNKLIPAEVTFLQRKVRNIVKTLPSAQTTTKMIAVFSNAGSETDAKAVASSQHLITKLVTSRIFTHIHQNTVVDNIHTLCLHLSETIWDRVAQLAHIACDEAELVMDVNRIAEHKMPKPSAVHDLEEPPELPAGISLQSLACLIGIALRGSRAQRLQLLFYLCYDDLTNFLANHPAGGVPTWILEVGQSHVVSLASLTHYHYYGTAFLPAPQEPRSFCPSQSKTPVSIPSQQCIDLVTHSRQSNGIHKVKAAHTNEMSSVMRRLAEATENGHDYVWEVDDSLANSNTTERWTLEEYYQWAENNLTEHILDGVMHLLFATGIMPSYSMERELVQEKWYDWQKAEAKRLKPDTGVLGTIAESIKVLVSNGDNDVEKSNVETLSVWGGIGNIDGGGGIGHGVMYCIPKLWWDEWVAYVGWMFAEDKHSQRASFRRPGVLSTDELLEKSPETIIPGTYGAYEFMKQGLIKGNDYVIVPPGVWDVFYEMYGGGPPLPRMVKSPKRKYEENGGLDLSEHLSGHGKDLSDVAKELEESTRRRILTIPNALTVKLHPWIIQCQLCDPLQPYRRGDTGQMSIRLMATPDQPLWRLFSEILIRFPIQAYKAYGAEGKGMARLWKRTEQVSRYGPWVLICKGRHASFPIMSNGSELYHNCKDCIKDWKDFTDDATVEGIGLSDNDHIMLEFAVMNKTNQLIWPREAAAKAGRVKRLAEEDMAFRNLLLGLDEDGNILQPPPDLVGMEIDAADSTGRWYTVRVLEVSAVDEETDEDDDDDDLGNKSKTRSALRKRIRVDFKDHGGYGEWIDVESDRLAKAGRFTGEAGQQQDDDGVEKNTSPGENKARPAVALKRSQSNEVEQTSKVCFYPGYGACGLTNLGNTCYANSAIQCIGYMPLLRAYLLSSQYKTAGDLNKDNPLGTGGKLLEEFAELLRVMWSGRFGEKSPNRFRSQLGKINTLFSGSDQQDAQEFLNYILDVLHEDCNKVRKKPYVESLEDDWVRKEGLQRVGNEAWRRFLRRNRSVMTDIGMGQVLNTVTCPTCKFSSRNFDPFNIISIPIPTVADVLFECIIYRRATVLNSPHVLNRPRKNDKRPTRFTRKISDTDFAPPSESLVAESYIISMSRLADSSDLGIEIQKLVGIPINRLRLCRAEEIIVNADVVDTNVLKRQIKVIPLTDKEGPCSQLAKKRGPNEDASTPFKIMAFETTLNIRSMNQVAAQDDSIEAEEESEEDVDVLHQYPKPREQQEIQKYLEVYGDELECRVVDTDTIVLAKALSRSLWPRSESELKVGLRVDAKDHRGSWFSGSVVEMVDEVVDGGDADSGDDITIFKKKVKVHFDNFSLKWDEKYAFDDFKHGIVVPLYSHALPRTKPTEFMVHHRHTSRSTGRSTVFGQSFFLQCQTEWTTARAGAHILAQSIRFFQQNSGWNEQSNPDESMILERDDKSHRLFDRTCSSISDLIDILIDCDREFIRLALCVSNRNSEEEKVQCYRNPTFDAAKYDEKLEKRATPFLHRLPFEIRVCTVDTSNSEKPTGEEKTYPFSLTKTIGNFLNARDVVVLQWREPPTDKKVNIVSNYLNAPVMYAPPRIVMDNRTAEILKRKANEKQKPHPGSAGIDLGLCLTEFCKAQDLSLADNWRCPHCKEFREGQQNMNIWRLPDLLTFHIKRFNMSARWREKITTKVKFPLTGLDMSEWCHHESPEKDSYIYDLVGVVNHLGSMTGGHYIAVCKATACGKDGREEVAYTFNGMGANDFIEENGASSGWRLGRKDSNPQKITAAITSKSIAESAEPLWLQFDDEMVEPTHPKDVVTDLAYVLFYRRRHMTPSNIAKYSTLE